MYYEILKEMNPRMKLAIADGSLYVLKEIGLEDTQMYQKLIRLDCKNIVRFYDTVAQDGRFYAGIHQRRQYTAGVYGAPGSAKRFGNQKYSAPDL